MTTLAEDTWRIGTDEDTGLLMGVDTPYEVVFFRIGLGPINTNDVAFGNQPGVYPALDMAGGKTVALSVEVSADEVNSVAVNAGLLIDAWTNADQDIRLYWRLLGQPGSRYLVGRPRLTGDATWDDKADAGTMLVELDFFGPVPTIFLSADDSPANF